MIVNQIGHYYEPPWRCVARVLNASTLGSILSRSTTLAAVAG